jgi:hypothetical protein
MAEARVQYRCDGCGQTDDHPKFHYAAQVFHHDCIPAYIMDELQGESYYRLDENSGQLVRTSIVPLPEEELSLEIRRLLHIRALAEKGTRGTKLLEKIQNLAPAAEMFQKGDN